MTLPGTSAAVPLIPPAPGSWACVCGYHNTDTLPVCTHCGARQPCILTPGCEHGIHAASDHPCGKREPMDGTPCQFCDKPEPCTDCWRPATIADLKYLAALAGKSVDIVEGDA